MPQGRPHLDKPQGQPHLDMPQGHPHPSKQANVALPLVAPATNTY